jgi:hypothetical protein
MYINIEAALTLAKNSFSDDVNKTTILLFGNITTIANGVYNMVQYGGWDSEYSTLEEGVRGKNNEVVRKIKSAILGLKDANVNFILLRPEDTSYDQTWYNTDENGNRTDLALKYDGSKHVLELYGTIEKPTYGTMFMMNDKSIDTLIENEISVAVLKNLQSDMKKITITNSFSKEIVENFTFEKVGEPTAGKTTGELNNQNNSITWTMDSLEGNKTATLKYKLKIKDMKNEALLDKVIAINEKVTLSHIDSEEKENKATLDTSPKIKLANITPKEAPAESPSPTVSPSEVPTQSVPVSEAPTASQVATSSSSVQAKDETTAKTKIPQTGANVVTILAIMGTSIILGVVARIKLNKFKGI